MIEKDDMPLDSEKKPVYLPRPNCPICEERMPNTSTTNGVRFFQCMSPTCGNHRQYRETGSLAFPRAGG